jgi:uncharacterized delta-60 repeat protein
MKKVKVIFLVAMLLMVLPSVGITAPGDLDTTFNTPNGYVFYNGMAGQHDHGNAVAIQSDGKIIVVGESDVGTLRDALILRYNSNGTLDTTFGTGGVVIYDGPANAIDEAHAVAIQPDGKIVVVGSARNIANYDVLVLRYNSNGTLDATFGTGGVVLYNSPTDYVDNGNGVVIQPDGKIVVAGERTYSLGYQDHDTLLLRLNSNGTLDPTFGVGGAAFYDIPNENDLGYSVALQPDGKIVMTGTHQSGGAQTDLLILRYNSNGVLDTTFGSSGVVLYGTTNVRDAGHVVTVQPDGKILVVGNSYNDTVQPQENEAVLLRYNNNGTLDSSFGSGGVVIYNDSWNISPMFAGTRLGLALQPDGKIVVAGTSAQPPFLAFVLLYNDDGTFFSGFGSAGVVTFSSPGGYASAQAVAYQTDGKIVATGVGTDTGQIYSDVLTFRLFTNPPNQAPVCDANGPYDVECGVPATLDGSGSYDPDGDPLTFSWSTNCTGGSFDDPSSMTPALTLFPSACVELCNVYIDVTDPGSLTDACSSNVNVADTQGPEITCPADVMIECDESADPSHTGNATATDICDTNPPIITYSDNITPGECPQEETIERTWTATDSCGNANTCVQTITVEDTTPPEITDISASPDNLWPPNHKMVPITVDVNAKDNCGVPVCSITSVASNEPENGLGDGDTAPDWEINGDLTVNLRAERSGTGSGRVYTITITCDDGCDNESSATVNVTVSHDKGK